MLVELLVGDEVSGVVAPGLAMIAVSRSRTNAVQNLSVRDNLGRHVRCINAAEGGIRTKAARSIGMQANDFLKRKLTPNNRNEIPKIQAHMRSDVRGLVCFVFVTGLSILLIA